MNQKIKISFFFLLVLGASLTAQEKWTLDACVAYALQNNSQLNDYEYTNLSNKETYAQSIRNLLPTINGSSNYYINFGRSTDPFTNDIVTTDFFTNN